MKISRILPILCLFGIWASPADALSLVECLRLAQQQNLSLQAAALEPVIAGEAVTRARKEYLPRVDARGAYTVQKDPQAVIISGRSVPTQQADYLSAGITAEQTLYDFGLTSARVSRDKARQEAAAAGFRKEEQNLFLRTTVAYYSILEAEDLRKAAEQEVEQFADHLRVAQSLYRQGTVTRNDVLQAQVQLADSRQLLLARQNQLENSWLQLNYLTGRPAEARGELEAKLPFALAEEAPPPAGAVSNRPELQEQQQVVAATQDEVLVNRRKFWPTLFAQGGIDYVDNKYVAEQAIYSATIGLRVNLFDGFSKFADYRESVARMTQERRRLQDLQEQSQLEYRTALNDAQVAEARVKVAAEAILAGEENLRINRNRYREQVGTATDVIDAQTLLTRTRTEYFQALLDYQLAVARVKWVAGELHL